MRGGAEEALRLAEISGRTLRATRKGRQMRYAWLVLVPIAMVFVAGAALMFGMRSGVRELWYYGVVGCGSPLIIALIVWGVLVFRMERASQTGAAKAELQEYGRSGAANEDEPRLPGDE